MTQLLFGVWELPAVLTFSNGISNFFLFGKRSAFSNFKASTKNTREPRREGSLVISPLLIVLEIEKVSKERHHGLRQWKLTLFNTTQTFSLNRRISAQKHFIISFCLSLSLSLYISHTLSFSLIDLPQQSHLISSMEIPEKLLKFRFHFLIVLLFSLALFSLILLAPRFLDLLAYFWPLLLSTALVLALVLVFAKTSPLPSSDGPGEGLLDYVAGHHEPPLEIHNKAD